MEVYMREWRLTRSEGISQIVCRWVFRGRALVASVMNHWMETPPECRLSFEWLLRAIAAKEDTISIAGRGSILQDA